MKIEEKKVILEQEEDYEFIKLISYVVKMKYGEIKGIKVKNSKPYQIVESEKSILLTKDAFKDSKSYGD